MAPRIEKAWGAIWGLRSIKKKESSDDNFSNSKQQKQGSDQQKEPDQKPADRETLDKAMSDLRHSEQFSQAGLQIELLESKDGFKIKLTRGDGALLKTMSAEEFLRLRDNTNFSSPASGKILDQKF